MGCDVENVELREFGLDVWKREGKWRSGQGRDHVAVGTRSGDVCAGGDESELQGNRYVE